MKRIFKPRSKKYLSLDIGNKALVADFYYDRKDPRGCYLHIFAPNGVFEQKVVGKPYAYLIKAAEAGDVREIEGFCILMWRMTQEIYEDVDLYRDVIEAFGRRDERLLNLGVAGMETVTEEREMADEALMRQLAIEADAVPAEREKLRNEFRQDIEKLRDIWDR